MCAPIPTHPFHNGHLDKYSLAAFTDWPNNLCKDAIGTRLPFLFTPSASSIIRDCNHKDSLGLPLHTMPPTLITHLAPVKPATQPIQPYNSSPLCALLPISCN
ncbi:hypothetical protein INT47_005590, partial [Mucor saturninus]